MPESTISTSPEGKEVSPSQESPSLAIEEFIHQLVEEIQQEAHKICSAQDDEVQRIRTEDGQRIVSPEGAYNPIEAVEDVAQEIGAKIETFMRRLELIEEKKQSIFAAIRTQFRKSIETRISEIGNKGDAISLPGVTIGGTMAEIYRAIVRLESAPLGNPYLG